MNQYLKTIRQSMSLLSPGVWVIIGIAALSTAALFLGRVERPEGLRFWTFSRSHKMLYDPIVESWNDAAATSDDTVNILLLSGNALQRRLMSGLMSGTPVPDLVEAYSSIVSQAFKGPLDDVGFVDLTERLQEAGLLELINRPSFSPWTTRGRIFGLPHDVHPVLLAYRADIVDAAGIDVGRITTWAEFATVLAPLMADEDGDGYPDRYLLNFWETNPDLIEVLILQAGGGYFDESDSLTMDSPVNARVLASLITWTTGPGRFAVNAPEFDAAGNRMRIEGTVLCSIMPDWLAGAWIQDLPQLAGKVKLMPLPAWTPGGIRTSVMGGTMLGIPKRGQDLDKAWEFARHLYLSRELAHGLFAVSGIITPVKTFWADPVFHQSNPYFSGQANGRLYIEQAPHVPVRSSSPYSSLAAQKVADAAMALKAYARRQSLYTVEELLPEARRLLRYAEQSVRVQIERNVFLSTPAAAADEEEVE